MNRIDLARDLVITLKGLFFSNFPVKYPNPSKMTFKSNYSCKMPK